jgi:hypothetical protein
MVAGAIAKDDRTDDAQGPRVLIVYNVGIIDRWTGWQKPADLMRDEPDPYGFHFSRREFEQRLAWAGHIARRLGWEGDTREGPYVTAIPDVPDAFGSEYLIGWTQNNNGTTFIASPFELRWLTADAGVRWEKG